jgi:hypothetical protein
MAGDEQQILPASLRSRVGMTTSRPSTALVTGREFRKL